MKTNELKETTVSKLAKKLLIILPVAMLTLSSCSKDEIVVAKETSAAEIKAPANKLVGHGWDGGYYYQAYIDDSTGGWGQILPWGKGDFGVRYGGMRDFVGGKGWLNTGPRNVGYWVSKLWGGYDFVGVYGFTKGSVEIEYYITEFGSNQIPNDGRGWKVNDVWVNGHNYQFYKHLQKNQPAPSGTKDFWQYIDNWGGGSLNKAGSIDLWAHINNWKKNGGQGWSDSLESEFFALEAWAGKSGGMDCGIWQN